MFRKIPFIRAATLLVGLTVSAVTHAQAPGAIKLQALAEQEVQVLSSSGAIEKRLVPAEKVVPGEEVVYTIFFTNTSAAPVDNIAITDPVPADTRYKAGSAFGPGTDMSFSVDGANFDRPENLRIVGVDGRTRLATAADYSHLRWLFKPSLGSGERGFVRFRAILK